MTSLALLGCDDVTVVYVVSHAEESTLSNYSGNPPLTASGYERARELAARLDGSGIEMIIATDDLRTQQTAAPIATKLGLLPVIFDPADAAGIREYIDRHYRGRGVLVVGHPDTMPDLVGELGDGVAAGTGFESGYDNLYIVVRGSRSDAGAVRTRYGELDEGGEKVGSLTRGSLPQAQITSRGTADSKKMLR